MLARVYGNIIAGNGLDAADSAFVDALKRLLAS